MTFNISIAVTIVGSVQMVSLRILCVLLV